MQNQVISIVGAGKLGAPLVACFAACGYSVIAADVNPRTVSELNDGMTPVFEPGLNELIQEHRGRITATVDPEKAVVDSEITFILVPTPTDEQGGFSLRFVLPACEAIGKALRKKSSFHLVVLTSTVMPGATGEIILPLLERESGKRCGVDFGLCYNPEFVALGTVIHDFFYPDFLLIGESDPRSGAILEDLYKNVCHNNPPFARMNFINAELTKLAVNTFVTTKITYANMLARICEQLPEANVDVVTSALGLDSRIGRKYLKGAIGYGGPCFPRDNLALAALARRLETPALLAEATDRANRAEVEKLAALVRARMRPHGVVAVLGLAYKPNTNVVEESQGLYLAQRLASHHISVIAYDPAGMENAQKLLPASVRFASSAAECATSADVIVLTTPWEEFLSLSGSLLARDGNPRTLIDCWRLFDPATLEGRVEYVRLGLGKIK